MTLPCSCSPTFSVTTRSRFDCVWSPMSIWPANGPNLGCVTHAIFPGEFATLLWGNSTAAFSRLSATTSYLISGESGVMPGRSTSPAGCP